MSQAIVGTEQVSPARAGAQQGLLLAYMQQKWPKLEQVQSRCPRLLLLLATVPWCCRHRAGITDCVRYRTDVSRCRCKAGVLGWHRCSTVPQAALGKSGRHGLRQVWSRCHRLVQIGAGTDHVSLAIVSTSHMSLPAAGPELGI